MSAAGEAVELVAAGGDDGERLDVALARHPAVGSRAAAQRLIDAGRVTVDGRPRPKRHRLRAGERVEARPAEPEAHPGAGEPAPHEVVFEDDCLLVVDKPAGVVVHPAPGHRTGTLAQALAGRAAGGPDPWRPGIVHRLDRDTSGLMVVAKSDRVHRALQEQIRRREVERDYLALVDGRPDARSGTIDAPIGRDRRRRTAHSTRTDAPREARTHFEVERALPRTTLLRVRLETGRTHQIRVHLAAIEHPVCGDPDYGGSEAGARLGLTRQFLHSARIRFTHPETRVPLGCESKLPVDLLRALEAATREPVSEGPDGG
ncbi:MAG TPA: RluA family pseudouridine synthase [Thermoleophilaceae bacterium]